MGKANGVGKDEGLRRIVRRRRMRKLRKKGNENEKKASLRLGCACL